MTQLLYNIRQTIGTATDKSGTTTGASVRVIAANALRLGYCIECPVAVALNANGDSLYVGLGAAAGASGASWEVLPGGYFPPSQLAGWIGDVYVYGASGIKYAAVELT